MPGTGSAEHVFFREWIQWQIICILAFVKWISPVQQTVQVGGVYGFTGLPVVTATVHGLA